MGEAQSSPDRDEEVTQRPTVDFPPSASTSVAYYSRANDLGPVPKAKARAMLGTATYSPNKVPSWKGAFIFVAKYTFRDTSVYSVVENEDKVTPPPLSPEVLVAISLQSMPPPLPYPLPSEQPARPAMPSPPPIVMSIKDVMPPSSGQYPVPTSLHLSFKKLYPSQREGSCK
ncbi:hypothetical protein Adt_42180 [Abeliophyllum distichum]|uniref:Uncharacterized protein n=1 Tax=Abeliophyllum distichum TaxID=126358 RepID=A0ABD1PTQ4_9LAMI